MKVLVSYPDKNEEQLIIRNQVQGMQLPVIEPVISLYEVNEGKTLTRQVYIDEKIEKYIVDIVFATRFPDQYGLSKLKNTISYGASPRASINLALAAKAHAFMQRRGFVIPDDIKTICKDVMRHRIGLTYEAEAENITAEIIIGEILRTVNVP
jgi:MoxR-like ATPase